MRRLLGVYKEAQLGLQEGLASECDQNSLVLQEMHKFFD
ncbi:MAG: hypothetical protein ACJA06_000754 [Halocynthiibacter sp.]|jgi:hypothetical protein